MSEGYLPPVVISVLGDNSDFFRKYEEVRAALNDLRSADAEPTITADIGPLDAKVAEAEGLLDALGNKIVSPKIVPKVDLTALAAQMAAARAIANLTLRTHEVITGNGGWGATTLTDTRTGLLRSLLGDLRGGDGRNGLLSMIGMGSSGIPFLGGMAGLGTLAGLMGFGAEHVLGLGLGIAGSGAGALGGAGLLGLGALGTAGVGMGTDMAGIGQAAGDIRNYTTAMDNLNRAIAVYGKNSIQAKAAQYDFNQAMQGLAPATVKAIAAASNTANAFHMMFDKLTGPAETIGAKILNQAMLVGEKFLPTIGQYAAKNMGIIQQDLQPFFAWLQNPKGGLGIFTDLEKIFTQHLPTAVHAFTQGFELLAKTIDTAAHYTGGFLNAIDRFVTRYNGVDFGKWQTEIGKLIGIFHVWGGFLRSVGRVLRDLFKPAVGTGTEFIQVMTRLMNQIDGWLQSKGMKQTLGGLFGAHNSQIQALGSVLQGVLPILEQATQAFLHLSANGTSVFVDLLKAVTPFLVAIGSSKIGATLLGWAGTLALIRSRMGSLMNLNQGKGLSGALGAVAGRAGYGAIGGLALGQLAGAHGDALNALAIGGAALGGLSGLPKTLDAITNSAKNLWSQAGTLASSLSGVIGKAGTLAGTVGSSLMTALSSLGGLLATGATRVWAFVTSLDAARLAEIAQTAATWLAKAATTAWDAVLDANPIVLIIGALVALGAGLYELITHWKTVTHAISRGWDDIRHWFGVGIHWVESHWRDLAQVLLVVLTTGVALIPVLIWRYWKQISGFTSTLWHDVTGFFTNMWHDATKWVGKLITDVVNFFTSLPGKIMSAISGLLGAFLSFGENLIKNMIKGIENMAGSVASAVGGILKHIPGGGLVQKGLGLVGLAGGTNFAPGGYTLVGERGPELMYVPRGAQVTPTEQTGRMLNGMGGNKFEINVTANTNANPYELGHEIGWHVGQVAPGVH